MSHIRVISLGSEIVTCTVTVRCHILSDKTLRHRSVKTKWWEWREEEDPPWIPHSFMLKDRTLHQSVIKQTRERLIILPARPSKQRNCTLWLSNFIVITKSQHLSQLDFTKKLSVSQWRWLGRELNSRKQIIKKTAYVTDNLA